MLGGLAFRKFSIVSSKADNDTEKDGNDDF